MIRAIIFDCFGVLVGEGWKPFRDLYFSSDIRRAWANEQMQQVSRGEMSHEKFAELMHRETGVSPEDFLQVLHTNPANVALLEYIEAIKNEHEVAIGFLSNVGKNRLSELFTPHQLSLFDELTLSYELGIAKPHADTYLHTARQLGVDPKECVFVDDTKSYCRGAEVVGMRAIFYIDFVTFKDTLDKLIASEQLIRK